MTLLIKNDASKHNTAKHHREYNGGVRGEIGKVGLPSIDGFMVANPLKCFALFQEEKKKREKKDFNRVVENG